MDVLVAFLSLLDMILRYIYKGCTGHIIPVINCVGTNYTMGLDSKHMILIDDYFPSCIA